MKGTDVEGLDLLPADFSYRHLDIELDKRKKPLERLRQVLDKLDGDYDLAILDCAPSISLVSESVFSAADLLLVPIMPSTLSVRTFEQLQGFLATAGRAAPGGARVPLDGRPPQEAPPRADGVAARDAPGGGRRPRSRRPAWSS